MSVYMSKDEGLGTDMIQNTILGVGMDQASPKDHRSALKNSAKWATGSIQKEIKVKG